MERELGMTLVKREKPQLFIDTRRKAFFEKSLQVMADFYRLCKETKQIAGDDDFALRIGYLRGYEGAELQRTATEFAAKYPDIPKNVIWAPLFV